MITHGLFLISICLLRTLMLFAFDFIIVGTLSGKMGSQNRPFMVLYQIRFKPLGMNLLGEQKKRDIPKKLLTYVKKRGTYYRSI